MKTIKNHRIPSENCENHENQRNAYDNHKNYETIRIQ